LSEEPPLLKLSWSRIRLHQECQRKGALTAAGMKSPLADVRVFFRGNVVDLAMRRWLEQDDPRPGWMDAHVDELFEKAEVSAAAEGVVKWRTPSDKAEVRVWCRELVTRLEPILIKLALPHDYQPASRFEVPLTIPGPDGAPRKIALRGEIDLTIRGPGAPASPWDLKGTEDSSYWRKVTGQLLFYEIALRIMTGEWPKVSGLIQPMCPDPVLPFHFSEDDRMQMFQTICRTAEDIWRGELPAKAGNAGCSQCACKSACPKFAHGRGRVPASR
jgi:hypothetical protein